MGRMGNPMPYRYGQDGQSDAMSLWAEWSIYAMRYACFMQFMRYACLIQIMRYACFMRRLGYRYI